MLGRWWGHTWGTMGMTRGWRVRLKKLLLLLLSIVYLFVWVNVEGQWGRWAALRRHCGTLDKIGKIGGSAREIKRDIGQHQTKNHQAMSRRLQGSVKNVQGHDGKISPNQITTMNAKMDVIPGK